MLCVVRWCSSLSGTPAAENMLEVMLSTIATPPSRGRVTFTRLEPRVRCERMQRWSASRAWLERDDRALLVLPGSRRSHTRVRLCQTYSHVTRGESVASASHASRVGSLRGWHRWVSIIRFLQARQARRRTAARFNFKSRAFGRDKRREKRRECDVPRARSRALVRPAPARAVDVQRC